VQAIEPANTPQAGTQAPHIATQLHEVGMRVALSNYHRHGAYITEHCGLATWEPALRQRISQMVLGHQGKLRKLEDVRSRSRAGPATDGLRIAVQLCHTRREPDIAGLQLRRSGMECRLSTFGMDAGLPAICQIARRGSHGLEQDALEPEASAALIRRTAPQKRDCLAVPFLSLGQP
jgi:hypothetical protein